MRSKQKVLILFAVLAVAAVVSYRFIRSKHQPDPMAIRVSGNIEVTDVEVSFQDPRSAGGTRRLRRRDCYGWSTGGEARPQRTHGRGRGAPRRSRQPPKPRWPSWWRALVRKKSARRKLSFTRPRRGSMNCWPDPRPQDIAAHKATVGAGESRCGPAGVGVHAAEHPLQRMMSSQPASTRPPRLRSKPQRPDFVRTKSDQSL